MRVDLVGFNIRRYNERPCEFMSDMLSGGEVKAEGKG
jgi:hypothetical protein